jgi:DNA-binding beta-propeller fold protein YncE
MGPSNGNATPSPEVGTLLGEVGLPIGPQAMVYDSGDGCIYALSTGAVDKVVTVLRGTTTLANLTVGPGSYGIAYDPMHELVYVSNYDGGSENTVSVINGTNVTATVTVGADPMSLFDDPARGWVYSVGYYGTITVINGTEPFANLSIGNGAFWGAYDPVNGYEYFTNYNTNELYVYNGTRLVSTVGAGPDPDEVGVDAANGWVYVTDPASYEVSVVNGTRFVTTIGLSGSTPYGLVYDARHHFMDVSVYPESVVVLNGTKVKASVSLKGPASYVTNMVYDPGNGYMYVPYGSTVAVLDGTTEVGSISLSYDFSLYMAPIEYDPSGGLVYAIEYAGNAVAVISTVLALTAPEELAPNPGPAATTDVGQTIEIAAELWGLGTGSDLPTAEVSPADGAGCSSVSVQNGTSPWGNVSNLLEVSCSPGIPGQYELWLNASDGRSTAWAWIEITAYRYPVATTPVATVGARSNATAADPGQPVSFSEAVRYGTGNFTSYLWSGFPAGTSCNGNGSADPVCTFQQGGTFELSVSATDSAGATTAESPPLGFFVGPRPTLSAPTADRTSADVGQAVTFRTVGSGGTGVFESYRWTGLANGSCSGLDSASPTCTFPGPSNLSVSAVATDSAGQTTPPTPPIALSVYALPTVTAPMASRASLDEEQAVNLTTSSSGGYGTITYLWTGLPGGCAQTMTSTPKCVPDSAGAYSVTVQASDQNGGLSVLSDATSVTVDSDPTVAAPNLSAASIVIGDDLTIRTVASGGSGSLQLDWSGLPPGCAGAFAVVTCQPTSTGTFAISVSVTDSNGFQVGSTAVTLVVASPMAGPGAPLGGLSMPVVAGLVGGLLIAGVVAVLVVRRGRHG